MSAQEDLSAGHPQPQPNAPRPPLRIVSPDAPGAPSPPTGPPLSAEMRLSEFVEAYVVPVIGATWKAGTLKDVRKSVSYWVRFTGDPPLSQISQYHFAAFKKQLEKLPGCDGECLADNTIRKHCGNIQQALDAAGPETREQPLGTSLLVKVPYLTRPSLYIPDVEDVFTLQEIGWWLEACRHATAPRGPIAGDPCTWWRSLGLFDYNTGLRIGSLLKLLWEWIEEDEHGKWLKVPAAAIKRKRPLRVFLNDSALLALSWLPKTSDRIFHWPHGESWLHAQRRRILKRSEIRPARRYGFHAFRKALATELGKLSPTAAAMALGHAGGRRSVTIDHYQHRVILVDALHKLPQPTLPKVDWQRMLFE